MRHVTYIFNKGDGLQAGKSSTAGNKGLVTGCKLRAG
jgi:hypothetical protein